MRDNKYKLPKNFSDKVIAKIEKKIITKANRKENFVTAIYFLIIILCSTIPLLYLINFENVLINLSQITNLLASMSYPTISSFYYDNSTPLIVGFIVFVFCILAEILPNNRLSFSNKRNKQK